MMRFSTIDKTFSVILSEIEMQIVIFKIIIYISYRIFMIFELLNELKNIKIRLS